MKPLKSLNNTDEESIELINSSNNNTDTTLSSTRIVSIRSWRSKSRIVQNFRLIWLDSNIDEINHDDSINKLREVVNTVNKFMDIDECIDFMVNIKDEKIFMICSGELGETTVPLIHHMAQIHCIYIFCEYKTRYEEWSKVKGVYTDIISICEALKQTAQECDQNLITLSFIKSSDEISNEDLDTLDKSFMYTQLLKEILLTLEFEQNHLNEFFNYCREQFMGNDIEVKNIDRIEREYYDHQPIWWYTYNCFLYSMLNRALRLMEVDLIIKMGFFIRDLHNHIVTLHNEQNDSNSFIVYRGQGLSHTDFDQLKNTQGGLISFNNLLSTSLDQRVSYAFAESNLHDHDLVGVLFEITINPSISSSPFAKIGNIGYYPGEKEILFSMHSVFRIGSIKQINHNDRFWQVDLTLTSDDDPQLRALTKSMQEQTELLKGWSRLGMLLIKMGHFNKANELYEILLEKTDDENEIANIYYMLGRVKRDQGEYTEAIKFHEKALEIHQNILSGNHPHLGASYGSISLIYSYMGEYSKALSYYEKALEIDQEALPENHPNLAGSYNNVGSVYDNMGEYSIALSYNEKGLEIYQKTLPSNHPYLANSYNNIGNTYNQIGEYSKALSYYEQALKIFQKTLPENHPDLITSHNNIGTLYYNIGEYAKALSYYEKNLEISQKILPANHFNLAISYDNIGNVYNKMHEYSKALPYLEKALDTYDKDLSENHPHLATSYNNIGLLYNNMGEYSTALSYYEKALEIRQKSLPENHPDFTQSYNNIGLVYENISDYTKALLFYERTIDIGQHSLPANHPNLEITRKAIERVKKNL